MFLFVHSSEQSCRSSQAHIGQQINRQRIHWVVVFSVESSSARLTHWFALWCTVDLFPVLAIIQGSGQLWVSYERNREWVLWPAYLFFFIQFWHPHGKVGVMVYCRSSLDRSPGWNRNSPSLPSVVEMFLVRILEHLIGFDLHSKSSSQCVFEPISNLLLTHNR